ncbi:hypothetical protein [Pedobacter mendelii]|uniref:hypothetical protein n=1 Tax=Pedobacter mendelii TaxID=1908240 RepID=UPI00166411C6|nr:hypothetical protein [Pedobacter mendelii]
MRNKKIKSVIRFFLRDRVEDVSFMPFFRLSIGIFSLIHFLLIIPDFETLYGKDGIIDSAIMNAFKPKIIPSLAQSNDFLFGWANLSDKVIMSTVAVVYLVFCMFLILGFLTRYAALLLIILHTVIFRGQILYSYGVDSITSIALFYCFIFPVGKKYSLDSIFFKQKNGSPSPYRKILQLHLCLIYVSSGFVKLMGVDWRSGEAIWQATHQIRHNIFFDVNFDVMGNYAFLPILLSWSTLIIELFYPLLVFTSRISNFSLLLISVLHIGIAVSLGLYYFSLLMIIMNLTAFLNLNSKYLSRF